MLNDYRYAEQSKHYREWAVGYNAKIESAIRIQRDRKGNITGWVLEAAIPFTDLAEAEHAPPQLGDVWLFNVFRIAQKDATNCEYSAWVPTHADFHPPYEFPRLRFVER